MELRVLKYFLAVASEGSLTKAATVLHITQPTLSRQMQDLETELHKKLFVRNSHSITLTAEGHLLRQRAEEITELADKTKKEFLSEKNKISGTVYIGSGESSIIKLVTDTMKEIQVLHKNIKFNILSGNSEILCEKLEKGLLDFAILIGIADISKYDVIALPKKERWGLLMKKSSPLAQKKSVRLKDLYEQKIIVPQQVDKFIATDSDFNKWFSGSFNKLNITAYYNLIYNAGLMIKSDMGYALGLDNLITSQNLSDIVFRPLEPKIEAGLNIVWKKQHLFSPAAKLFLDKLKEKFKK